MKKKPLIVLLLTICLIIASKPSKSQIISPYNVISGIYEIDNNGLSEDYTQKILMRKDSSHIALTTIFENGNSISRFYLIEKGKITSTYADIRKEYKVKDFSIMGDSLYFCGSMNTVDQGFNETTQGFIAYVRISELFTQAVYIDPTLTKQCNYSRIPTTTTVNKIKTYYNRRGERMVIGIGEQYYSELPYERPVTPIEPPLNKDLPPSTWVYPDTNYYDCFIGYKITETILNPAYPSVNPFTLYRHKYFKNEINHPYEYEEFQDLVLTDNYICLASTQYFNPIQTGGSNNSRFIVLRRIDKEDFNIHSSYRVIAPYYYNNNVTSDGFYIERLGKDTIAIAHVSHRPSPSNILGTIVTKVDLGIEPFNIIHTSLIDENSDKVVLRDIEYLPEMNNLLVLRSQLNNGIFTEDVQYVDMDNSIFDANNTYISKFLFVLQNNRAWNNILKYNRHNFALIGNFGTQLGLGILDNEENNFIPNYCRDYRPRNVYNLGINSFNQWDNLFPCNFALMYLYSPGFYYPGNTTIIHKMDLNEPNNNDVIKQCLEME
ncbi:MAG: hypothetical protein PHD62_08655 [Bacteroidales bacterium]|nr:hypothetical protein [Bacteroidales bacterium]